MLAKVIKESLLLKNLMVWSKTLFSQIRLNKHMLSQHTKKIPEVKRKVVGL